jgi:hypothetical protein
MVDSSSFVGNMALYGPWISRIGNHYWPNAGQLASSQGAMDLLQAFQLTPLKSP